MQNAARMADFTTGPMHTATQGATASVPRAGLLRKCWGAFKGRRERARVRAILYGMHDRELKDLGFTRSEIESVMVDDSGERIRAYPKPTLLRF
jgi:uncharacterized protein YjiS (DUF1127 family)